jgi:hypothetical protein
MPCPVCIGYRVAENAKYIQDDQEDLDALWKELDEMLAEDKNDATIQQANETAQKDDEE